MNPFLEQRWGDVRAALITYLRDQIQEQLPPDLRARMQERVFVESYLDTEDKSAGKDREFYPDVHVVERPLRSAAASTTSSGALAVAEPIVIRLPRIQRTESYIEIIDARSGGRVVSIIEILSQSNKTFGPGRDLYQRKQREAVNAGVNLIEVDLLRGGRPVSLSNPDLIPVARQGTYHASVWRAAKPDQVE